MFDDTEIPLTIIGGSLTAATEPWTDPIGDYLVVAEGSEPGKHIEIKTEPLSMGRDARQSIVFTGDSEVSRQHARVSLVGGQVVVEDLGSTNGTFLNGQRITKPSVLNEGALLRVGHQILKYERRSRREVERADELNRDLRKAANYVHSLLPAPITSGAVRADWHFHPSMQLGGDAFGYDWLDEKTFILYLMDVSGHGVGAAMHSVTVMNVLRQRALPGVDFANPADVLSTLNGRFQMDSHDGMYLTMWYGVYRTDTRTLAFSAAGHHPACLVPPGRDAVTSLGHPDLMIGAIPDQAYQRQQTTVVPGSTLYLFSDGVFEIVTTAGQGWMFKDLLPVLLEPATAGTSEPARVFQRVKQTARPGALDDDFSLVAVTFQ